MTAKELGEEKLAELGSLDVKAVTDFADRIYTKLDMDLWNTCVNSFLGGVSYIKIEHEKINEVLSKLQKDD